MQLADPDTIDYESVQQRVQDPLVVSVLPGSISRRSQPSGPDGKRRRVGKSNPGIGSKSLDSRILKRAVDDREQLGDLFL